jgi:hypothetical protein
MGLGSGANSSRASAFVAASLKKRGDWMYIPEEVIPQRTIRRDAEKHSWVLVDGSSHESTLPWSDEAPAINVVLWLKTQMGGRVNVTVEL